MPQDLPLFLGQLLRRPHEVVALAPSSEALARKMAKAIPKLDGPVVELGAGTGKITQAILNEGVAPQDLHAFEMQFDFVEHLRAVFPQINVHAERAEALGDLAPGGARAVVSGLPLLSMPNCVQSAILEGTRRILQPGGRFIQFTYGPTPPVAESVRTTFGLTWTKSARVWNNLPPARVYSFRFEGH